ncbi:MAG TPA: TonB-dependent receptor [Longimicrobium sp.]|jgi:outer membrane receptor protein involved in Fe transport|uniref:TonB-dependent receptor domain-containing protein n=1 Tax=Longimicrobium sp. TaxID=2029185 RepID=UPI002ED97506
MNVLGKTLAAVVALAIASPAAAQNPTGQPPAGARPTGAPGAAQQQGGTVRGTVLNPEGQPVNGGQVAVWSAADSTLVTGAVARPDGTFRIDGLRPGRYYLRVSALGYSTATTAVVAITPQAREADVGTVRLAAGAIQLEGLTVTAEAAPAGFAPDRNTYSTRDMPSTAGGNATDVLQNVPAVEVDQDGKVSLRGNQNVAVQINGRPSPMTGDQLGNFLRQLPANMVERVEVIPNPSARYEPEGMAGIINIVLKQNADLGLSGGFIAGVGTEGRYNGSGNLGWQAGDLTLFGSYGFRHDTRESTGLNYLERYATAGSTPISILDQEILGTGGMTSHIFNGSADYKLTARDVVSSTAMLSLGQHDNDTRNLYLERDAAGTPLQRYAGDNLIGFDDLTLDGTLSWKRTITPQQHELSTELRFNRGDNEIENRFSEQALTLAGDDPANATPRLENLATDAVNTTLSLQADYTRPLGERSKLETGYKGTRRMLDNDLAVSEFDYGADAWMNNALRSNAFEYDETVHAGYAVLNQGVGKVDLQAGLRVERTDREFFLENTGETYPKGYWSFFPSGLASFSLDDQQQLRLSYSRRIQRPDTRILNPFGFNEDQRNRFVGNPALEPEYTHALEVAYQRSLPFGSVQVTPFFRRTENAIRRIREFRADTTISTFANLETSDSYGADLNGSVRLGKVSGFASVSAFRQVTSAGSTGDNLDSDGIGWSARVSGNVQLTPRLDLQGFMMYRAPMDVEQGRMGSFVMSTLALRQKVMGEKGSVSLRIVDPLDRMGFSMQTSDPLYYQLNERRFGARAAYLTFSYNFGQTPRLRNRPPAEAPEAQTPNPMGTP